MIFLRVFTHLLPRAKAWRVTTSKALRNFLTGLAGALGPPARAFVDAVWLDIFPSSTREAPEWDAQWGLPDTGITEQERRDRLDATWKALGGQDPNYIQTTLRANGFDVYVHEWWVPGTEPAVGVKQCAVARSPLQYLRREFTGGTSRVDCGEALAACGEEFAACGNGTDPRGYPLVNRTLETVPRLLPLCGEAEAACGEAEAACGNYDAFVTQLRNYIVPEDPATWPYFLYIGAADINDIAQVAPKRRDEFEALCLKICPAQQWLGILVEYT